MRDRPIAPSPCLSHRGALTRTSRRGWLEAIPLCLFLASCGSRSELLPAGAGAGGGTGGAATTGTGGAATVGTGGAATTGTGGTSTSSGGAGGAMTGSCDVLVVDGQPLSPSPAIAADKQRAPWLAAIEPDGTRAALVYEETTNEADPFAKSSSVALDDPWGAWPASLGTSAFHGLKDGFVVGPGRDGRFSMLTTDEPNNAGDVPTGMVVWAPQAGVPGAMGQFFDDVPPGVPACVASNGGDHLAGFRRSPVAGHDQLALSRVVFGQGPVSSTFVVACSVDAELAGAAIPFGDGFLAAYSNGRPYNQCLRDRFPDGPPTRLHLVRLPAALVGASLTYEQDVPDHDVARVRLTRAAEGAWAAWERTAHDPPADRSIELLRVDAAGFPASGRLIQVAPGEAGTPFALASLGSLAAIATLDTPPDGGRTLTVRVLGEDGAALGDITLAAEDGYEMDPSVALLGSPSGDRLLVAWGESSAIGNDNRRVRLARLACAGP